MHEAFKNEYDGVARKFYFIESDVNPEDKCPSFTEQSKSFFLKATLLADATVLPTTNPALYCLPKQFPELFYKRANDQSLMPRVSFLFQANYKNYSDEFSCTAARLQQDKSNAEGDNYKNVQLDIIKRHDDILDSRGIGRIKKATPTSILLKKFIKQDIIGDDSSAALIPKKTLSATGIKIVADILDEFYDKSIDRHTIYSRLKNYSIDVTQEFKQCIHECFYLANESSINNISTYRRNSFSEVFVNPFMDMLLFNAKTGLQVDDLKNNVWFYECIRENDSFNYLRGVYFDIIKILTSSYRKEASVEDFEKGVSAINASFAGDAIDNMLYMIPYYVECFQRIKVRRIYEALKQKIYTVKNQSWTDYAARAVQGGMYAISLIHSLHDGNLFTSSITKQVFNFMKSLEGNARIQALTAANERHFEGRLSPYEIDKQVTELQNRVKKWVNKPMTVDWGGAI